jgi:hypothetical protein
MVVVRASHAARTSINSDFLTHLAITVVDAEPQEAEN